MHDIKNQLRLKIRQQRKKMTEKEKNEYDNRIYENILNYGILTKYELILVYFSTEIEVNTHKIINYCHENNIAVAIPKCEKNQNMKFYYYNKNSILEKSAYGIFEPVPEKNKSVENFNNTLCIVPGLSFDKQGYRLGYGGGFYDRFIDKNPDITTVGICYSENIADKLPIDFYDKNVDYLITDKTVEVCNGKKK